ncbi:MAG: hypothetical protein ACI8QI_000251 [Limisphaerales bacterium]|jgi:hypothetical protein
MVVVVTTFNLAAWTCEKAATATNPILKKKVRFICKKAS